MHEEWLQATQDILVTDTKVPTINEALHTFAIRKQVEGIAAVFRDVEMDFEDSERAWRYGGGRDLSRLADQARHHDVTC